MEAIVKESRINMDEDELKRYTAMTHNDHNIITVYEFTPEAAEMLIKTELNKNPSRKQYYQSWKKGEMQIRDEDGNITRGRQYLTKALNEMNTQ